MNLAQVINPRTGHIDSERVLYLALVETNCGSTLDELLQQKRVVVRKHERRGPPGQGRNPEWK